MANSTVYPILFVGCGGSGGVTLQFTMDALRAEIATWNDAKAAESGPEARIDLGPHGLPKSWQFVHIDVPERPDGSRADRPPSVPEQGGTYVALAPPGFSYQTVSDQLWARGRGTQTRHLLAGWLKRPAPATDPTLTSGAGQMRNVGRAVTLFSLGRVSEQLEAAAQRLASAEAREDLARVASLIGADTALDPVVFIVSSMSGGAGASMVLDVARLLARLRPGWIGVTSMFLYTSEVFSSLAEGARTGVEGNGLAAMGELLATSLGANGQRTVRPEDDEQARQAALLEAVHDENQLLAALGFAAGGSAESQTFKRVFPIGNTQGDRAAVFGDGTMDTIYRALGRGLSGLVASPSALSAFRAYDLTNSNPRDTDRSWLGQGSSSPQEVLWGNFGFARLSLGRDKYGEYLAQRLSREAVDRLAGLAAPGRPGAEREVGIAADAAHARLLADLGLPVGAGSVGSLVLLSRRSGVAQARAELEAPVRGVLSQWVYDHPAVQRTNVGRDFAFQLGQVGRERGREAMAEINKVGYRLAFTWLQAFVDDVVRAIEGICVRQGIPVARQVIIRLKEDAAQWSRVLIAESHALAPAGSELLPPPPRQYLDQVAATPLFGPDNPLRAQLREVHSGEVSRVAGGRVAGLIGEALADFGERFATPFARALASALSDLEAARSRARSGAGVADPRTNHYSEWPEPRGRVPSRFRGAHNEVMLIDPDDFPAQVEAHMELVMRQRGAASPGEAKESVLQELLTDRWPGHNDEAPGAMTLRMSTGWIPPRMSSDPDRPEVVRVPSAVAFQVGYAPGEILGRARAWLYRPKGEVGPFLRQGIRGYLAELDGPPADHRRADLVRRFEVALQHAAPLAQVDPMAFGVVHPNQKLELELKFSAIPVANMPGVVEELRGVLRGGAVTETSRNRFDEALSEGAFEHIDVFGSYAPLSPLAVPSLLKPLARALSRAESSGSVVELWRNRRARPLAGCLAMTPLERRSLIAGYVVGRMTGRIRGSYEVNPYERPEPLAVLSEQDGAWLPFPSPLLTPHAAGYDSDEVAALLEAHLVAVAQCGFDGSLSPLRTYSALRSLWGRPDENREEREYDVEHGARRYLAQYIVEDVAVPGGGQRRAERGAGPTDDLRSAVGRKAATLAYLAALADGVDAEFGGGDPRRSRRVDGMRFEARPLLNSLAPDLTWAVRRLSDVVETIPATGRPVETAPDQGRRVVF